MKDYTEQLKKYWKTNQFSFIAILKKNADNKFGFFIDFINPINNLKLLYPTFEDIQIEDKRVSLYNKKVQNLIDGDFYKVELEYNSNAIAKNNPYLLQIKNVEKLDQDKVKQSLIIEDSNTVYVGQYQKISDKFCCFKNVMFKKSGDILMHNGEAQQVFVSPNLNLKENSFYTFHIKVNEGKLPNAIPNSITELKLNPYQEYIRLRFERLNNPEANKMIAKLMREIGKGMYDSKQRMIFELLQNADDAPGKEKVGFHIDISGDYFFIMHDGAPFSKDDMEAITSAAESTKRADHKKTGYKGIGFKSVFTDSTEVWVKSGGYQFSFLRNSPLFSDFDNFYFSSKRYVDHPEFIEEDILKFGNQRLNFDGSTDIPWQVIPIWQNKLPNEFHDTNFDVYPNPVQIALKIGKNNIEEYKTAIEFITTRPQFLLFLRNTSQFNSPRNGVIVLRTDFEKIVEIKRLKGDINQTFQYEKRTFEDIEVSNEAFQKYDIGLKKQTKTNKFDIETYFFSGLDDIEIETIPPKLASALMTEISFGISLIKNQITAELNYLSDEFKYSSLFTYLPMEDTRFKLPFLVNADFVPSSNREKIQGDNLWNKYILINVAEKHVLIVSNYALDFIIDKKKNCNYLSLLLKNLLPNDDSAQILIDSYNDKYLKQLKIIAFVANDSEKIQLLDETILDDSGFTELFGHDLFYEIIDTNKRLPHIDLNVSYLKKYDYLDVEMVDLKSLATKITPKICQLIGEEIANDKLYENSNLLKLLDKLVLLIPNLFGKIPFIVHQNKQFSLDALFKEEDAWVLNANTIEYKSLFDSLGYHTIDLELDTYTEIKRFLSEVPDYLNDKTLAFDRISKNSTLSSLDPFTKVRLIDFFKDSKFMNGIGEGKYFGELNLFNSEGDFPTPLSELLSRKDNLQIDTLRNYRICQKEFDLLPEYIKNKLIQKEAIFPLFILNSELFNNWILSFNHKNINRYVSSLKEIYSWLPKETEILQSQWSAIPWLFFDETSNFIESNDVYWSEAFFKMNEESYEILAKLFYKTKLKVLPNKFCGDLIKLFNLNTNSMLVEPWDVIKQIDTHTANTLLDWMEADGNYGDFFDNFTLVSDSEMWDIVAVENYKVFDGENTQLKTYIRSIKELKLKFKELNSSLSSQNRVKIGLLQGDKFLKAIIETKLFDQDLAKHLPAKSEWKLIETFITNLSVFKLQTDVEYDSNSAEHILVNQILKHVEETDNFPYEISNLIVQFRGKIKIDDQPIRDFDLSDVIRFGKGEDRKELKLSDVLEEFKGESDVLDKIIESFVGITNKTKLRKLIFKTRKMDYEEIANRIEENELAYYTVHQVIFQHLIDLYVGPTTWKKEEEFDVYLFVKESFNELVDSYILFMNLIYELQLDKIDFKYFGIHGEETMDIKKCVLNTYAIESEKLRSWLINWIQVDSKNRLDFITKLGFNGSESSIVKLRKSALAENYNENEIIRYFDESKSNISLLRNTIKWLSDKSSKIVTKNIKLIQLINDIGIIKINYQGKLDIPIISDVNKNEIRSYSIVSLEKSQDVLVLKSKQEYSFEIFDKLRHEFENSVFVDESCGIFLDFFMNKKIIELEETIDFDKLFDNIIIWDAPFYVKWEFYKKYPIHIYNGNEMPYLRTFNDTTINGFTLDLKIEDEGEFYVSKILKNDILNNLPDTFPNDKLQHLKDWHYRTLEDESLLNEDTFEYKENIDRLIQDRLGISFEEQKKESGNAKTHAVYFLDSIGFDVSKVKNNGASLLNIIDPQNKTIECIVRSAKGGLLYLDKEHWDMLKKQNTCLVVIYPGNSPRLFKDREELLSEELAKNVLFRFKNTKNSNDFDGIFSALKEDTKLILVTSEKMKETIFSKLKKNNSFRSEGDSAVADDNFEID